MDDEFANQDDVKVIAKKIGKELKSIMVQKDMKQIDVAEKYGTSKNAFNNLINRKLNKVSDISKIARFLNCSTKITFIDNETGKEWDCSLIDD